VPRHRPTEDEPYALLESTARPGNTVPLHRHDEDEVFTVLEGELTITAGEKTIVLVPQASLVAPSGMPHRYVVTADVDTRWLVLTAPGRFDAFVRELSRPAATHTLPPSAPGPPPQAEIEHLTAVAARHGIEILG
jgi:mannose-6-phosphate isomerase-like protein (cupin superfamily)